MLYENHIKQSYLMADKIDKWLGGEPLQMHIKAFFEIPKSTSKRNKEKMLLRQILPTKKPDADNIAKVICDALNGIAYRDDTQIVSLVVTKVYTASEPKVVVGICEMTEEVNKWQE